MTDSNTDRTAQSGMQIEIRTDNNIVSSEAMVAHVRGTIEKFLDHFAARITRVDVHIGDANGDKHGGKRCSMETHLAGRKPMAVHDDAASFNRAIHGAARKMKAAIEHALGRVA